MILLSQEAFQTQCLLNTGILAEGVASPRQPSPAADDELGDDAMECFLSSLVDDHVSTMMSAGIGDAVRGCERQLRLKLRGAMWELAGQLRIACSSF